MLNHSLLSSKNELFVLLVYLWVLSEMLKSSFTLNKTWNFTRIIALTWQWAAAGFQDVQDWALGGSTGHTESAASADAETGLLPEAAGQSPGRSGCSHTGKWAQSRAQRMHAEEAVSPRQGQECLQEKKGVIPPGTLGIELKNKPNEQRPPDLKPKAPNRSHASKESPGSDVCLSVPKHFTCSSASGRRVCVLVISRVEAVTLTCLEVLPARCRAHCFAYRWTVTTHTHRVLTACEAQVLCWVSSTTTSWGRHRYLQLTHEGTEAVGVKDLSENVQRERKRLANSHCAALILALRRNLEGRRGRVKGVWRAQGAREKTGTHTT